MNNCALFYLPSYLDSEQSKESIGFMMICFSFFRMYIRFLSVKMLGYLTPIKVSGKRIEYS